LLLELKDNSPGNREGSFGVELPEAGSNFNDLFQSLILAC